MKEHEIFERHCDDIVVKMPITISQAALGDSIKVPTPHGNVKLKIPAGTQGQTTFRLRGKGVPNVRTKRNGDQHVVINVVTPTNLSKQQAKLFEQLSKTDLTKNENIFSKFMSYIRK